MNKIRKALAAILLALTGIYLYFVSLVVWGIVKPGVKAPWDLVTEYLTQYF